MASPIPQTLENIDVELAEPWRGRASARRLSLVLFALTPLAWISRLLPLSAQWVMIASWTLALAGPVVLQIHRRASAPARLRRATVDVRGRELAVRMPDAPGEMVVLRYAEVQGAWLEEKAVGHDVVAVMPDDLVVRIHLRDRRTAARVLRALRSRRGGGTGPLGRVPVDALDDGGALGALFALTLVPLALGFFVAAGVGERVRLGVPFAFVLMLVLIVFALTLLKRTRARVLEVGRDGIAVRNGFRQDPTFVSFNRLVDAHADDDQVVIRLESRWQTRLDAGRRSSAQALARALKMQARAPRTPPSLSAHEAPISKVGARATARSQRTQSQWKQELVRLVSDTGHYRTPRVAIAELVRVVEHPAVPVDERVGAAVAVAASGDRAAAKRVRIASDSFVEPAMKRALAAALEGDIDELAIAEAERASSRA